MRKVIGLIFCLLATPIWAASVTCPSGSLCIGYVNAAGTPVYVASATINNATAAQFLTRCRVKYAATLSASTDQGCFFVWANDWYNQTIADMQQAAQTSAAATASAAVVPPAIVPQQ